MSFDTVSTGVVFFDHSENIRKILEGTKTSTGLKSTITSKDELLTKKYPVSLVLHDSTNDEMIDTAKSQKIKITTQIITILEQVNTYKQLEELITLSWKVYWTVFLNSFKFNGMKNIKNTKVHDLQYIQVGEILGDLKDEQKYNVASRIYVTSDFYTGPVTISDELVQYTDFEYEN